MNPIARTPVWKRIVASVLDFITVFMVGGYIIGALTGSLTPKGVSLDEGPTYALLVVIVVYFLAGRWYAGGTLWDRLIGIHRPQPK